MEIWNEFFHLKENPFSETPDTQFYFASPAHTRVLKDLAGLFSQGRGFALLTGDVGTGKTLLCRMLLKSFQSKAHTALIFHPVLNDLELLDVILEEFKVERPKVHSSKKSLKVMLDALNEFLIREAAVGKKSILIVDDAQRLSAEALDLIRILSNLETEKRKLIHIILVGQKELTQKLATPELRQLDQRISVRSELCALDEESTRKYILHRIEEARIPNFVRFHPKALELIYRNSCGVPRLINRICESLLLRASERGVRFIDARMVREVPAATQVVSTVSFWNRLFHRKGSSI
jgi:general secretion pathway protein A